MMADPLQLGHQVSERRRHSTQEMVIRHSTTNLSDHPETGVGGSQEF